jgi:TonB family protein
VHTDPVVSIAIRSDGSVEDVTILRSSGRPDIDELVRRIVRLNARYSAFPANVAANYDVIELRRVWTFRRRPAPGGGDALSLRGGAAQSLLT